MQSMLGFSCHTAQRRFDSDSPRMDFDMILLIDSPLLNLKSITFHPSYNVQGEEVTACFFTVTVLHLKAADMIALAPHQDEHSRFF